MSTRRGALQGVVALVVSREEASGIFEKFLFAQAMALKSMVLEQRSEKTNTNWGVGPRSSSENISVLFSLGLVSPLYLGP